ncbi:MAG: hypothetical protein H6607_02705 [Flavobacteriales bacterium]|nr:hypothetical protein [Flavobacteriales bacterium]
MKNLIYTLLLLTSIVGCIKSNNKRNPLDEKSMVLDTLNDSIPYKDSLEIFNGKPKKAERETCLAKCTDFLKLKDVILQKDFFNKLDSVLNDQYPNNDKEKEIFCGYNTNLSQPFS